MPHYRVVRIDGPEPVVTVYRYAAGRYEETVTVTAGESVTVTEPFPITIEPSRLLRRRGERGQRRER